MKPLSHIHKLLRNFILLSFITAALEGCIPTSSSTQAIETTLVPGNPVITETAIAQVTPIGEATATLIEPTATEIAPTPTTGPIKVNRDEMGNIIPNPPGEWTKLPQGENQRILIGPEGSNIVLELNSRLGMSEFMFNIGEDGYFTKDGKTPQDRIYEAVNGSLYYYWCSTQGGGCTSKPIDMKGKNIDFWSYRNKAGRGNIQIDNGVIFKVVPLWDKSGGPGNWIKLTDGEKVYHNGTGGEEFWYEVDSQGRLIIYATVTNIDSYKEHPYYLKGLPYVGLLLLASGRNLHSKQSLQQIDLIGETGAKYYPEVSSWIKFEQGDITSQLLRLFTDFTMYDQRKWDANIFLVR